MRLQQWLTGLALLVLALGAAAAPPDPARELADTIDKHMRAAWDKAKIQPAPVAGDAEFLRRVTLHLAGRIPSVSEVREFLADKKPDKRERSIKRLLESPRYVVHFVNVWRSWMMPEADASIQARFLIPGFENWLRGKLSDNTPYDKLVHELLTAPIAGAGGAFFGGGWGGGPESPSSYYVAKELKPENLGASAARMFLGIRLECAQCHNHPFAEWKRDQFWQFAAFFSGIKGQTQGDFVTPFADETGRKEIAVGGTDKVVQARFPDGSDFKPKAWQPTRKGLADWVTSANNPYFARATVNRVWDYFFSMGLIDPVDEMVGAESINAHPELLEAMAKAFIASKFDLKFLIRAITTSKTYQLSSLRAGKEQTEAKLFARFPLRGMTAEQLYDSVATATGYDEANPNVPGGFFGGGGSARSEFIARFAEQTGKATEFQTSILQALSLMNGKLVENATSLERSEILLAVTDNPFMTAEQRIETLYLAALSRMPKVKELSRMMRFVEEHAPADLNEEERDKKRKQALADVFWTLLNSAEFILNH